MFVIEFTLKSVIFSVKYFNLSVTSR